MNFEIWNETIRLEEIEKVCPSYFYCHFYPFLINQVVLQSVIFDQIPE